MIVMSNTIFCDTVMIKNIKTGSPSTGILSGANGSSLTYDNIVNSALFFRALDPEGQELWKFDP